MFSNNLLATHVVISESKTNSNFRRKTNLAGTSTVRVCNGASPRRAGWQIHNLQSRTAWKKKKVAKAGRVLAFEGMFIEQHTFLCYKIWNNTVINLFMHQLYYSELVGGWMAAAMDPKTFFVLWDGLMTGLITARSPPNDTRFGSKLLCYVAINAQ